MQTSHKTTLMLRAKVVVVGDACVGKTAVVQMFKSGGHDYPKNYIMVSEKRGNIFPPLFTKCKCLQPPSHMRRVYVPCRAGELPRSWFGRS